MNNKCNKCGGTTSFSPVDKGNKCNNCGAVFPIEYTYNFNKKPFSENYVPKVDSTFSANFKNFRCNSCGSNIVVDELQMQSTCPYCGNTTLFERKASNLMHIDSIIPFSYSKNEAFNIFKSTLKGRFFANKSMYNDLSLKDVYGAYVNAFVFDFNVKCQYSGVLTYTKTVKDADGTTHTETAYQSVSGTINKPYKNLTIEANSNLNQAELHQIMPYNYNGAVEFKYEFMNGYVLEYQDRMFNECVSIANNYVKSDLRRDIINRYNCEDAQSLSMNLTFSNQMFNYCLLPVYFVSKTKNNKNYKVLMNGQTGKVGHIPNNKLRVTLAILLPIIIVAAIIILACIL